MVQVEPLGILLAAIFVISVGGLLIWMFRVPKGSTMSAARAYSSLSSVHKVLVAITDAFPSERAIGLGCRIGQEQGAEMLLLNVILMPYSMALDDPAPEEEKRAENALEMGAAIAKRYGYRPNAWCATAVSRMPSCMWPQRKTWTQLSWEWA